MGKIHQHQDTRTLQAVEHACNHDSLPEDTTAGEVLPAVLPLPGELATAGVPLAGELPLAVAVAGIPPEPVAGDALRAVSGTALLPIPLEVGEGEAAVVEGLAAEPVGFVAAVVGVAPAVAGDAAAVDGDAPAVGGDGDAMGGLAGTGEGVPTAVTDSAAALEGVEVAAAGLSDAMEGFVTFMEGVPPTMVGLAAAVTGLADAATGMAAAVEGVATAVEGFADGVAGATEAVEGVADAVKGVADGADGGAAAVVVVATAVRGVAPVAEEVAVGVAPAVEGLLPLLLDPASPALLGEVVEEGGEEIAVVAEPAVGGKLGEEGVTEAAPGVSGVFAVTAAGFEVDGVVAKTGDDAEVVAEAAFVGVEPGAAGAAAGEVTAAVTEPEPGEGKEMGVVANAGVVDVIGAVEVPDGVAVEEAGVGEAVVGVAEGVIKDVTVLEEASGAGTGRLEGAGGGVGVEPVPEGVGDDDTGLGTGTAGDPEEEENTVPGDKEEILGLFTEEALEGDGIPEDCPGDETTPIRAADEANDGPGDAVRTAGDVDAVPGDANPGGVGDAWPAARAAAMLASMACSEVLAGPAKQNQCHNFRCHNVYNDVAEPAAHVAW